MENRMPDGFDEQTGKYYDAIGNEIQIGDICARIYLYNTLEICTVKSRSRTRCTFTDGSRSEYYLIISLSALGIKKAQPFYQSAHSGNNSKDALGNTLNVGDTVLFLPTKVVGYNKGVINSIAKQKVSIISETDIFGRPTETNCNSKFMSDIISLSAYGLEQISIAQYDRWK